MERTPKRPIHPWSDRLGNLPEGKGNFYHYGPNFTVDPIVIAGSKKPMILLIQRKDTGEWALPGGFIDTSEVVEEAGRRELYEETGVTVCDETPTIVYEGLVDDPRSTLNAWPETTVLLWRSDEILPAQAGDDARKAKWFPLRSLPDNLYGSHSKLIRQAIIDHGTWSEQLAYCLENSTSSKPSGGHMGYERTVVHMPHRPVFIKRHNPIHFTDAQRESHSRQYLQKEYSVYTQLAPQHPHTARDVQLINNHTLLLEAYTAEDNWHWRAPADTTLQQQYVHEMIAALNDIGHTNYTDTSQVTLTYPTLQNEGWNTYPEYREAILHVLTDAGGDHSAKLATELDEIYEHYKRLPKRPLDSFCHGDMRQSNVAWHPSEGVRIVDWSWAGNSPSGLDTTSFLIDLAKSGIDISAHREHFAIDQALLLIGFWLHHSTWPTPTDDTTVRQHQIASAVTAWQLVKLFGAAAQSEASE